MNGISGSLFAGAIACGFLLQVSAAQATREKVLYTFCSQQDCADGINPISDLIDVNGTFYGVTLMGGTGSCGEGPSCGTVFAFDPRTRSETVLYSFKDSNTDGIFPAGGVIDVKGVLYGTTTEGGGGSSGGGTVFALDPETGAETLLHSFTGGSDGYTPRAGLLGVKDMLYGTTSYGGGNGCGGGGCGTVFAVNRKTGKESVLHAFDGGAGGAVPMGALIEVNGTLYGTTTQGGSTQECFSGCGTVFAIDPKTGATTVVYTFAGGSDGSSPTARLLNVNGTFYGTTTAGGGPNNGGTVFSLDPQTGSETVLYSFCSQQYCHDGVGPGSLIDLDGTLYGTTAGGGADNDGTVFAVDTASGAETVLYSFGSEFNAVDGMTPVSGLLAKGQWLYGTTLLGGIHADGVLFRIKR